MYVLEANCEFKRRQITSASATNCEVVDPGVELADPDVVVPAVVVPAGDVETGCWAALVDASAEEDGLLPDPPQPVASIVIMASTGPAKRLYVMPFLPSVE